MFVNINQISNGRSSNKTLYVWIDLENGLFYCYFALSAMEKYLVESLLKTSGLSILLHVIISLPDAMPCDK